MKVLLDTNVILDVLLERKPYLSASSKIFLFPLRKIYSYSSQPP